MSTTTQYVAPHELRLPSGAAQMPTVFSYERVNRFANWPQEIIYFVNCTLTLLFQTEAALLV